MPIGAAVLQETLVPGTTVSFQGTETLVPGTTVSFQGTSETLVPGETVSFQSIQGTFRLGSRGSSVRRLSLPLRRLQNRGPDTFKLYFNLN